VRANLTPLTHAHREKLHLASFLPWFTLLLRVCRIFPIIRVLPAGATPTTATPPSSLPLYSATSPRRLPLRCDCHDRSIPGLVLIPATFHFWTCTASLNLISGLDTAAGQVLRIGLSQRAE
jgi:hypothetical protein